MNRIISSLKDKRVILVLGLILVLMVAWIIAASLHVSTTLACLILALLIATWLVWWLFKSKRLQLAAGAMESMFHTQVDAASKTALPDTKQSVDMLRTRLLDAVHSIKSSKLGQKTGSAALYELPWYIVIGNPAAGKSTAVINSGLNFPFAANGAQAIQGVGGTRNCDWFFTTEGILLDTAGRYAVHEEDRSEWFGFLGLLKKYRPKAPINGIVIVASIAQLTTSRPDDVIALAKQLRQRVQELTEKLELFAPVYVVFTKVDLIAGFVDFFEDSNSEERNRVWGATLPYDVDGKANAAALFEKHFDTLSEGIKELGTTRMSLNRGEAMSPGVLTFPLEFAGIRHHLSTFVATLFEDNPFQFKPIFRGFYFTSAIQEGVASHATGQRIVQRFGLGTGRSMTASISTNAGFFLKNLFSSVIFADCDLVRQYASRSKLRLRQAAFYGAVLALGLTLGSWTWSYMSNQQYVANIRADLDKTVQMQQDKFDLISRLEALNILQDRLEQLQRYRSDKPLALGMGLYQGERIENKLRAEYFKGIQQVMLTPVTSNLETFLAEVNNSRDKLQATAKAGAAAPTGDTDAAKPIAFLYKDMSTGNPEDAYNALKTYLMLADRERIDSGHLGDQLTRFWRGWLETNRGNASREQVIRSAEKLITYFLAQAQEPDFPVIENKLTLVDQTRDTLRAVVKGTPARERVYAEIKMRASTRFPAIAVAGIVGEQSKNIMAGSYAIPGTFTRDAWEQFVEPAIKEASTSELQASDWVLKTTARTDLSLEGSPEQIRKELTRMYKTEYIAEWKKFMQGITINDFGSFDNTVAATNRLGDPANSPLNKLVQVLYKQTSWDNPSLLNRGLHNARRSFFEWFRETILRQAPSQASPNLASNGGSDIQTGMVGKEFAAIAQLSVARGDNQDASLMNGYMGQLAKLRGRFNQIKNAGDIGPASRQLMQATLDGSNSELADALKYVDDNMLSGMPDNERATIRPLLVRPLTQAFAVIVAPAEQELNQIWAAQVRDPFDKSIGAKYPFAQDSRIEATPAEIALTFGPDGAIAKFVQSTMGPLVIRRGDTLAVRTWGDMGLRLNPDFAANLARYVASYNGGGASAGAAEQPQTSFQLQPIPTAGLTEYTVEIDGQSLRYRNGLQEWANFVWPGKQGQPGARISAVTADGRSIEIVNFPGQFGLEKLVDAAQKKKLDNGQFVMSWEGNGFRIAANFKLISDARAGSSAPGAAASSAGLRGMKLPATVVGAEYAKAQ
jgi:type VI secretion system protein ImpL